MQFVVQAIMFVVQFCFGWIGRFLPQIAGFFGASIIQLLVGLGFGFASFTGFNVGTSYLIQAAMSGFDGVPAAVPQLLGLMWVDKGMNLIVSSGFALMTIKGMKAGSITRMGWGRQ